MTSPLPAELRPLLLSSAGEPLRLVDEETHKVYVLVEHPAPDDLDDETLRNLIQPALDDEARGAVGPLDFDAIKQLGRALLAKRQSHGKT